MTVQAKKLEELRSKLLTATPVQAPSGSTAEAEAAEAVSLRDQLSMHQQELAAMARCAASSPALPMMDTACARDISAANLLDVQAKCIHMADNTYPDMGMFQTGRLSVLCPIDML